MHEMTKYSFFLYALLYCMLSSPMQAQHEQHTLLPNSSAADTAHFIKTDSTRSSIHPFVPDSLRKGHIAGSDSLRKTHLDTVHIKDVTVVRFIQGIGKLTTATDTENALYRDQLLWTDSKTLGDVFWKIPGFFYRGLGEAGKYGQLNAYGTDDRRISVLLDGRPMNDPITGRYNFNDMPLEFLDEVEILSGSENGASPNDVAVNFVSRSYNSVRPVTKVRFVQDPEEDLLTDFLYTQNIARGLNLMAAFDRTVTNGNYDNAALDAWNIRTRLRYNITDRVNISLSDFYTKAMNGLNYGILLDENAYIPGNAMPNNSSAHDIRSRHDLTFAAVARLLPDSISTTKLNVFYTNTNREYDNPFSAVSLRQENSAVMQGFDFRQDLCLPFIRGRFGYQWQKTAVDPSAQLYYVPDQVQSAVYIQGSVDSVSMLQPEIVLRRERVGGQDGSLLGLGVTAVPSDYFSVYAKSSWYDRFPSIQEQYWTDSLLSRPLPLRKEQHIFLRGGFLFHPSNDISINLEVFQRTINNAILYQPWQTNNGTAALEVRNVGKIDVQGITGSFRWKLGAFEAYGVMTLSKYKEDDTLKTLMPDVILSGEFSYRDLFFKKALDAKFGLRSTFYNRENGEQPDPETMVFSESHSFILGRCSTVDLFTILKVGDAHLSVTWANIFGINYILAPIYPMPGRHFRLGVHWDFLD